MRTEHHKHYFSEFKTPRIDDLPPLEEFLLNSELIQPQQIVTYLQEAKKYLTTAPGPNLLRRKAIVPIWLDYWIRLLSGVTDNRGKLLATPNAQSHVIPFSELSSMVEERRLSGNVGVLNVAGFEGHLGHRNALVHMAYFSEPLVLFEPDENFIRLGKPRDKPFLDLRIRLAMWRWHPKAGIFSVAPTYPQNEQLSAQFLDNWYQNVFTATGATHSFAYELDPLLESKVARGQAASWCVIPNTETPSTSKLAESLMDEVVGSPEPTDLEFDYGRILRRNARLDGEQLPFEPHWLYP